MYAVLPELPLLESVEEERIGLRLFKEGLYDWIQHNLPGIIPFRCRVCPDPPPLCTSRHSGLGIQKWDPFSQQIRLLLACSAVE
jgi:hypothetical protein